MSLAAGAVSSSKSMGYDEKSNESEGNSTEASKTRTTGKTATVEENSGASGGLVGKMSESSMYATEVEEDDEGRKIELGPQYTLKEQIEKDKVCFFMRLCFFMKYSFILAF